MALGYTIAAILKRSSHVFSDERVSVKIDWLEQLNRHYVQVMVDFFLFLSLFYLNCYLLINVITVYCTFTYHSMLS